MYLNDLFEYTFCQNKREISDSTGEETSLENKVVDMAIMD